MSKVAQPFGMRMSQENIALPMGLSGRPKR